MVRKGYIHTLEAALAFLIMLSYLVMIFPVAQQYKAVESKKYLRVSETLDTLLASETMDELLKERNLTGVEATLQSFLPELNFSVKVEYFNLSAHAISTQLNLSIYCYTGKEYKLDILTSKAQQINVSANEAQIFSDNVEEFTTIYLTPYLTEGMNNVSINTQGYTAYAILKEIEEFGNESSASRVVSKFSSIGEESVRLYVFVE
jgi:hypothetical protein